MLLKVDTRLNWSVAASPLGRRFFEIQGGCDKKVGRAKDLTPSPIKKQDNREVLNTVVIARTQSGLCGNLHTTGVFFNTFVIKYDRVKAVALIRIGTETSNFSDIESI